MTEPLTLRSPSLPATTSYQKTSILPFYSSMAAIAGLVFLLVLVYHCILARQGSVDHQSGDYRSSGQFYQHPNRGLDKSIWVLIPASKYQKKESQTQVWEEQCTVCLSVFADGEDIRQLPDCKHSFHKDCIDMWFYSHSNCPLCRSSLERLKGEANSAGMV